MKLCNGCHLVIPEDQMVFMKTPKGKNYQKPWCKLCDQKRYREYRGTTEEKKCGACTTKIRSEKNINYCSTECRIKLKVHNIDNKGCWITKYSDKLIHIGYKPKKAKRLRVFTFEHYKNMPLPKNMAILTKCENIKCINPDHLLLVTRSEVAKVGSLKATEIVRAKKDPIKKEILRLFLEEKMTIKELSEKYNKPLSAMEAYLNEIRRRFTNNYCLVCKKESKKLYNARHKYRVVCSDICQDIYCLGSSTINDILEKFYTHKWPFNHIRNSYKGCHYRLRRILKNPQNYKNNNITFELNDNELICLNCQKQHDNIGSEFCSPSCMQEFLLK